MVTEHKMDVARILILSKIFSLINKEMKVKIDNEIFNILMIEENYGLCDSRCLRSNGNKSILESSSEESVNDYEKYDDESDSNYIPETTSGIGGREKTAPEKKEE